MSTLVQLIPGTSFAGEFQVIRKLAEGGMGAVYEVTQIATGASRALKIMHPQLVTDEKLRQRFVQEAKVAALIKSDHVVQVVGAGVDPQTGTPWLAMEMLEGETLHDYVSRRGALAPIEVREVFSQLCHALAAAHDAGIVHRDLKPENVFLAVARREGVPFTVKVLDFGIAKLVAEAATNQTAAIGTPLWMAPEQTEHGGNVRPATDVWALGLIAFYLLTGKHYWRGGNAEHMSAAVLLREVIIEPLVPATTRAAEYGRADRLPPGFDEWFSACLVREIERRFQHARAVRDAFDVLLGVPSLPASGPRSMPTPLEVGRTPTVAMTSQPTVRAPSPEDDEPVQEPSGSSRGIFIGIGAAAVLAIGVVAFMMRGGGAGAQTPPSASASTSSSHAGALPSRPCPPGMVAMPGGSFFASSLGAQVDIAPYCLDASEVTLTDYAECVKKGSCTDQGLSSNALCTWPQKSAKLKHPISCVDWDQAAAYCLAGAKRLPDAAEWEWAARGADRGTTWPWGDEAPTSQSCWSAELDRAQLGTCEVKAHGAGASPQGAHDLAGNVAEWVAGGKDELRLALGDHFLTKTPGFVKDVSGRTSVPIRTLPPTTHEATIGFRCAMTP
ncbi:MAG: bifunctional serine/threonine-protein kinase/formylglycine-generating enzyme family protein [Polyangiales bacterium]